MKAIINKQKKQGATVLLQIKDKRTRQYIREQQKYLASSLHAITISEKKISSCNASPFSQKEKKYPEHLSPLDPCGKTI